LPFASNSRNRFFKIISAGERGLASSQRSKSGLTVPDVLNPIIVAENPQSLGYRLVDAAGTNFNRMFNLLKIETGDFAQRHRVQKGPVSATSFLIS